MSKSQTAPAEYEVVQAREIGGVYREAGETVALTPRQAQYYLPPYGAGLTPVPVKAATKPKPKADAPEA
ncbi:hypothetical protein [Palleronia caenipelagi]|uniref:DUF2635 domain-containing protein n=1 Tax=Palleronia caenipelagi TaxID=2489174 RepID=A0A547PS48_9RHOB|nr:hypothetical protein [Palleronia caenipelagi]TRD16965.1 hypothetical protein FEV53_13595 [Palleronia caenipelagi]